MMEIELGGQHILIVCTLSIGDVHIENNALIDCGVSGYSFVDDDFTRRRHVPTACPERRTLEMIELPTSCL